jgi:small neutral amino acid transporter SnatA (MarC family)
MESLIAIIVPSVVLLAIVTGAWIWLHFSHRRRELLSRERLALIEQGKELPSGLLIDSAPPTRLGYLLRSLIWLSIGGGIGLFFVGMAAVEGDKELFPVAAIAIVPLGVSLAYRIVYKKMSSEGVNGSAGPGSRNQ